MMYGNQFLISYYKLIDIPDQFESRIAGKQIS